MLQPPAQPAGPPAPPWQPRTVHCPGGLSVCARLSLPGKPRDRDSPENGADSFESSDSLLQSWNSQSSLLDVQRVPSFESFEDDCSQSLCLNKPTMSFKDYIQERSDPVEQGKPVIPAAVLAGFTGKCVTRRPLPGARPQRPVPPGCFWSEHIVATAHTWCVAVILNQTGCPPEF